MCGREKKTDWTKRHPDSKAYYIEGYPESHSINVDVKHASWGLKLKQLSSKKYPR